MQDVQTFNFTKDKFILEGGDLKICLKNVRFVCRQYRVVAGRK
jgi:hypothetical protein